MTIKAIANEELLRETLAETGFNPSKTARRLGIDYGQLISALKLQSGRPFVMATGPEPVDIRTLGRPGLQPFVVALKRCGGEWPAKYRSIIEIARSAYDAGTHEMCQQTTEGWVVLYSIPRKTPTKPRTYFATMGAID
ncbi:hypothetical protein IZ6_24790 [Terrihabitans soli]|uniref:DNA binding HTH domain-containing protein n=1 Tax=Terrihabitans soli TaxID=708113 RepID=A0A6S6QMP6_9HYPH|nr:helix-turn-helix domain-containing protein [Terrihabitans soli]BCJ91744.1 hypothetical protein IZ6_24790 [Terrihabitans soli]